MLDGAAVEGQERQSDASDALGTLHTRTVDALRGFAKMVEKAEPEFRPVAQKFHDLHAQHAGAIARILSARGQAVDADGSIMGTVNETVVGLRAFFDEIDEDVMDNVRSGEGHVLKAFDDALADTLQQDERLAVEAMRGELTRLLDETSHLD
ncbi:MAG: DUF2383 domain-containing protein [Acetobacteraceae bacterium]|nr:MAG: DUF2383 domain-containing protein [Acetobacteraceae bacterium]